MKIGKAIMIVAILVVVMGIASANDWITVGNAYKSGNTIVLTDNWHEDGAVWYVHPIKLNENFDVKTNVYLGNDYYGADGITFTIQKLRYNSKLGYYINALGGASGGLGYQGIENSVAVEIDTFQNYQFDPPFDRMAIDVNGSVDHYTQPVSLGNVEDGRIHTLEISWNASEHNLRVYFDGSLKINVTIDLQKFVGSNLAVIGFTGATGGYYNYQYVIPLNVNASTVNITYETPFVIDRLPYTIDVPGTYIIDKNITVRDLTGSGISIECSNVVLDGLYHTLTIDFMSGSVIYDDNNYNVTIKNLNLIVKNLNRRWDIPGSIIFCENYYDFIYQTKIVNCTFIIKNGSNWIYAIFNILPPNNVINCTLTGPKTPGSVGIYTNSNMAIINDTKIEGFDYGILGAGYSITVDGCKIKDCYYGIDLAPDEYDQVKIVNNEISNCTGGIYLGVNIINGDYARRVYKRLEVENGGVVEGNRIVNNDIGLYVYQCSGLTIYNNYFCNEQNVKVNSSDVTWNVPKTPGRNIVGGAFLGGNYWASPNGNGFSQVCPDNNSDGFCDHPFVIDKDNVDHLPLKLDRIPPQIEIEQPGRNVKVGTVDVEFKVVDEGGSGVKMVEAYMDGVKLNLTNEGNRYECKVYVDEGNHTLRVIAEDYVGNENETIYTFTAEKPKIRVTSIILLNKTIELGESELIEVQAYNYGDVKDSYTTTVYIEHNDTVVYSKTFSATISPHSYYTWGFDYTPSSPGSYTVKAENVTAEFYVIPPHAQFKVSFKANPGYGFVNVTVNVSNVGDATGSTTLYLYVDGSKFTSLGNVSLPPNNTTTLECTIKLTGDHDIAVGNDTNVLTNYIHVSIPSPFVVSLSLSSAPNPILIKDNVSLEISVKNRSPFDYNYSGTLEIQQPDGSLTTKLVHIQIPPNSSSSITVPFTPTIPGTYEASIGYASITFDVLKRVELHVSSTTPTPGSKLNISVTVRGHSQTYKLIVKAKTKTLYNNYVFVTNTTNINVLSIKVPAVKRTISVPIYAYLYLNGTLIDSSTTTIVLKP